jgi:hypothetical protein
LWLNADDEDSVSKYRRMSKFRHCKSTLVEIPSRIVFAEKCFFSQLIPHVSVDVDSGPGVQALLDRFDVAIKDIPVVIGRGRVFKSPSIHDIAEFPQMNPTIEAQVGGRPLRAATSSL